jgi:hypothetical protein
MTPRKRSETNENTPLQALRTPARSSHNHNNGSFQFINTSSSPFSFHTPSANMSTPKSLSFIDGFTPVQKKRKITRQFTAEDILNSYDSRQAAQAQDLAEDSEERRKEVEKMQLEEEDRQRKDEEQQLNTVLKFIESTGYPTLHSFVNALITTRDPVRSSQVSRMLIRHGKSIFDGLQKRQPEVVNDWAVSTVRHLVGMEGERLAQRFKPQQKVLVSEILKNFSMAEFLSEAEILAPSTCQVLRQIGFSGPSSIDRGKKSELVRISFVFFHCSTDLLLDSCNHSLYACQVTERACQRISDVHGNVFSCLWNIPFHV